ncbi:GntR family transcriptional regulator [Nocardiopsis sp. NPDC101807]|uniref:GntR family transcriptional regulator n=1 Tax=Nocardiopsis sp. NPDC101807 TaxID=3364339 RepID=UPI00380ADD76
MSPRTPWGTYHRIADALRSRIADGDLAPGDAIPSESALGEEFGVARTTVRRALAELASERLVETVPGTGRVVCTTDERESTPGDAPPPSRHRRIAADLRERIACGDLAPGDALPGEAALVRRYGVSRRTARQALSELEGAGLVIAVHGKGRFVQGPATPRG